MESTQHIDGIVAITDESFVADSEMERLANANNPSVPVPEEDELRTPGKPDEGDQTPIPAVPVDAADDIPAKDLLVPNSQNDGSKLHTSDDEDSLGRRVTRLGYMIGDDGTRHPMARITSVPESSERPYQISGPSLFLSSTFASLLEHDAQPRNEEVVEFSDIDIDYDEYINDLGSIALSPGARSIVERVEGVESFEARKDREVHLMASRGKKHRKDKHHHKKRKGDAAGTAYSSYDIKGKARMPGTRPEETEQIRLDKELAEKEQARIYEENDRLSVNGDDRVVEKNKAKSKRKSKHRKHQSKSHLDLTRWIETPEASVESRAPDASPIRALKQLPSGGYLAKAWVGGTDKGKRPSGHRVSEYTKRKLDDKEAKVRAWREGSDISEDGNGGGRGPPGDSPPSSSSSSESSISSSSSDNDTSKVSEPNSSDSGSSSSSSDEDTETHRKSRRRRNKKYQRDSKQRNALAKTIKYPEPSAYDGRAHLETFETFVFEFTNWIKVNDVPEKYKMMAMKRFLTGKAGNHYMTFAAVDLRKWDVDSYLKSLFNHCFPIHFRSEMRAKFNRCVQGSRSTREFLRELRTLGHRLPDIGDVQIRLQYWEGSNQYLRVEWAKAGMDPESSTLAELEVAAERFEMAETLKKNEDRRTSRTSNSSNTLDRSEKRAMKRKDRPRRWRDRQGRGLKWKKVTRDVGAASSDPNLSEKKPVARAKDRDVRFKRDKLSKTEKDELRAANKCFHCKQPGHLAKDCPDKKTIRPSVGAISLPSIDSLLSSVNSISLLSMSVPPSRIVVRRRRPLKQTGSSPFGDSSLSSVIAAPPSDPSLTDLVSNPIEILDQSMPVHRAIQFGWDLSRKLNEAPLGPEAELIAPEPGQDNNRRYRVYARRSGRTAHALDTFARRGFEISLDGDVSVDDVAEKILKRVDSDFRLGNLNWDYLWPRIYKRLIAKLEEPNAGLILRTQTTTQFEIRLTEYPEFFGVVDMRKIPERKGDAHPQYLLPFECLKDTYGIVNHVYWRSATYDRIRSALYNSAPTNTDRHHTNTHVRPWSSNRFSVTMSSPGTWWIQDSFTQRNLMLWEHLASDLSFDIGEWLGEETAVFDFTNDEFDSLEGSLLGLVNTDDSGPDLNSSSLTPPPVTANIVGSTGGVEDYRPLEMIEPAYPSDENESDSGEQSRLYDTATGTWSRRSPRPYTMSASRQHSPVALGERSECSDDSGDMPGLVSASDCSVSEGNELDEYAEAGFDWDLCNFEDADPYEYYLGDDQPAGPSSLPSHIAAPTFLSSSMVSTPALISKRRPKKKQGLTQDSTNRVERNSARVKDFERIVPHPIVVEVLINGSPARALVDTGSLADFISTKLVDQLNLPTSILNKPLPVQLATTGSRTKVNCCVDVEFSYQNVKQGRRFDVINLDEYDIILGTPFLYQYKVAIGFHPSQVALGTNEAAPIQGRQVSVVPSKAADVLEEQFEKLRRQLQEEARDLCKDITDTPFPPLRAVNHRIPLIDESKIYSYRPARCPDAMKPLWREKRDQYVKSGRWRVSAGSNASPLLILWKPKPGADGKRRIRTVVDKREQNANTVKLSSPLPDMETMLRNAAKHKYRSLIDGKDAYEQIRVVPEHVHRTLFNTPDGTMESLVLQQGDCNGGATYQALMNHIFSPYIGVFMDVYLDDILIYSDSVEDHIKHVRIVLDILRREKLYLSWDKMKFFARELVLLGHVITDQGIKMDPNKVDAIEKWKVPTNKELLSGFLGSVGYLANGIKNVRIPMAVLTPLTGSKKMFKWGPTEQRAFDTIKSMVSEHRNKYRTDIDDGKNAPPINVTCDASLTGAGGHLSQGKDLETAKNIAFWSGKFNSAQQNYPTHERELLAIVESLKRFKHMLYGRRFRIFTDHRALEYLMKQKNLSPRQARWLEFLCELDFDICYLPGKANKLSDALSRMYGNEAKGTVRAKSEFVSDLDEFNQSIVLSSMALRMGEPGTVDTGVSVFHRLGLSGVSVGDEEEDRLLDRPALKIKDKENRRLDRSALKIRGGEPDIDGTEPDTNTVDEATQDDLTAGPDDDDRYETNDDEYASDVSEEIIPAQEMLETRSGRVVKPIKRRDHDFERLYVNKHKKLNLKPRLRMNDSEAMRRVHPEPNSIRPKRVKLRVRGLEGEEPPKITTDPPLTPKSIPRPPEEVELGLEVPTLAETEDNGLGEMGTSTSESEEVPMTPEPMASLVSSAEGIDVHAQIRGNYGKDSLFKLIINSPDQYRNFEYDGGLLYLKVNNSGRKLCIPDVNVGKRKLREIIMTHAHTVLAHLSARKTLQYLREHVWWKGMLTDVTDFCESCPVCRASKSRTTKPYGLLKTLEIASRPWQSIGIDFVGPLPSSMNRHGSFDMICVIIDHLTCLVHLVPTDQRYRAKHIAEVVFDSVYKLHGLPERIVSDRDSLFTSIFWSHLHKLIGVELKMSTAYHPQTDGATERVNKTMVQMLRQCVSPDQKDWAIKLPAIEFAINSARSDTTGFSPFFLTYGRTPDPMIWENDSEYPGVRKFAQRMKDAIMSAHDAVIAARVYQTSYANRHRRPSEFAEGDLVYLSTENLNLPKGRSRKLVPKYIGPYRIKVVKSPGASYELDLPGELRRRGVHPVFHASLLRPHIPNDDRRFPGRDLKQLSAFQRAPREYFVDKIVSHYGKGKEALFKVAWTSGDSTWMTYRDVIKAEILQPYCEAMGVNNIESLPNGKAEPPNDVEVYCGAMRFWNIKYGLLSAWKSREPANDTLSTYYDSNSLLNHSYMNFQFTDDELDDFYAYDANLAIRLVAEDEGKSFTRILAKPAGYDDWLAKDSTISVASWVAEKRSQKELDVNEIGRKMIKRSLFRSMASSPSSSASRARNSVHRAVAFKSPVKTKYLRPGTPYPKNDSESTATGSGGPNQLTTMGGGLSAHPIPDAGSSNSFTTATSANHGDMLAAENVRLRRELEELKMRELLMARASGSNTLSTPTSGEIALNMIGLTVEDSPTMSPILEKTPLTSGDMNMAMNLN